MGTRQLLIVSFLLYDIKLKTFKTIHWRTVAACGERKELPALFIIPFVKHDVPEPLHHWLVWLEAIAIDYRVPKLCEV